MRVFSYTLHVSCSVEEDVHMYVCMYVYRYARNLFEGLCMDVCLNMMLHVMCSKCHGWIRSVAVETITLLRRLILTLFIYTV